MAARTQIATCCFCIKLRAGVVIISFIWLIYGIFETVPNSFIIISSNSVQNVYSYINEFLIPITVFYGLITIGAAFGLFVVTCKNTPKMMLIYSKVAYVIAGAEIISRLLVISLIIMYRSRFFDECTQSIDNVSSRIEFSVDACNQGYIFSLTFSIAFAVVTILSTVYFAMVIASYAYKKKEAAKNSYDETDETDDL
ncbi:hypothetical protein C1645_735408 [Glomus cerebriforme]|uniref:MARVEL domain-containing protein n=1 Tax=Glomus cerebriforme TaxID=658196 RepID=A0A397TF90_9GLOM|nr:hypothetical protein C1645_735408 [Glomus cerebriforme]